jgi:hypothetical protein
MVCGFPVAVWKTQPESVGGHLSREVAAGATRFHPANIQQNQPKHRGKPWNRAECRESEAPTRMDYCDRSRRTREHEGNGGRVLITQRSLVQIQPPQPSKSTGYGTRRSPLGFSRNVRLEITAPNLVVRIQNHRALHGQS